MLFPKLGTAGVREAECLSGLRFSKVFKVNPFFSIMLTKPTFSLLLLRDARLPSEEIDAAKKAFFKYQETCLAQQ
jgi:hypothetical protein